LNYALRDDQNLSFRYQRNQQDGGKRYDQLLGGDGNLIAELKNLMLDFGYLRYYKQGLGFFDNLSANLSYNSQREERKNQGGQGNPLALITTDRERTTSWGFGFFLDKAFDRNNFLIGGDYYHDCVTAPSFNTDPATRSVSIVRPRVPNGSTYDLSGVYIQDVFEAIPDRLRVSGALRYNVGQYRSRASDAPIVTAVPLFNRIPGYVLFNLRGDFKLGENQEVSADCENIADMSHRSPGWGIDGPDRSITLRYQIRF
jgi:hypothetical protein